VLRFKVYPPSQHAPLKEFHGLHLLGNDGVPVRGDVHVRHGEIQCQPKNQDPAALSLLWPVNGYGVIQLETTRLPERDQPYVLNVELARHRLMRISLKREEWGLFDYHGMEEISGQLDSARDLFVEALQKNKQPTAAARLADQSLQLSLSAGEGMCQFHAAVFLGRRHQSGGFARPFLGAAIWPSVPPGELPRRAQTAVEFVRIPFVWREIQPKEQDVRYDAIDAWVQSCTEAKLPIRGGPLLNFGVQFVPDWMYIWENDFDTIRDYAQEHVRRSVQRYADQIQTWVVASGLHADNVFSFNFEQIMEITRVAATAVRQAAPRAQIVLDLTQPWGEYFARNQRSVPPLLYADLAAQSGVPFDAFGLQFLFGIHSDGYHLRDALQISAMIDKLANLGKPLHVTSVAVPSAVEGTGEFGAGGQWHGTWTEPTQADWLAAFCEIALSKPYVESVCLEMLTDRRGAAIPSGGVLREALTPKPAFEQLKALRERLRAGPTK